MTELTALTRAEQEFSRRIVTAGIVLVVLVYLGWRVAATQVIPITVAHAVTTPHAAGGHAESHAHGPAVAPALYSIVPFTVLLMCIAILPLFRKTEHWWECNWNRLLVAAGLGTVTLLYYVFLYGQGVIDHSTHELSVAGWPRGRRRIEKRHSGRVDPFHYAVVQPVRDQWRHRRRR